MKKIFIILLLIVNLHSSDIKDDEKSCLNGNYLGCYNLGVKYLNGIGVSKDVFTAMELFRTTCENNVSIACHNAGTLFLDINDTKHAKIFFFKSCKGYYMSSCSNLGTIYNNEKNYHDAVNLFELACDGSDLMGCNNLGAMYAQGNGVPKNYKKAKELFTKACNKNIGKGCNNLAQIYSEGLGVSKDIEKSKKLKNKACKFGYKPACKRKPLKSEDIRGLDLEALKKLRDQRAKDRNK